MNNAAEVPQDSVLRRHWQASHDLHQAQAKPAQSQPTTDNATAPTGGFFSWLKSLFS